MNGKVKNPFNRKYVEEKEKAFKKVEKSVEPVAKDTNKTRRKQTLLPLKGKIKPRSISSKVVGGRKIV